MSTKIHFCACLLAGWLSFVLGCNPDNSIPAGENDAVADSAKPSDPPVPLSEGGEILMKAQRAYRALQWYSGTIETKGESHYAQNVHRSKRKYQVYYQAPDKLRFDGKDSNGDPLWIIVNGESFKEDPNSSLIGPTNSPREALQKNNGASQRASVLLPAFLLGIDWTAEELKIHPGGKFLLAFAKDAKLKGTVKIDGHECHEVECVREEETWIFAVDKKIHLIRQIQDSASEEQMKLQRRRGGGGFSGRIVSNSLVQTFHIDSINEKIDPAHFKID